MLYVFDLDDTLYLETAYIESAFRAIDHYLRTENLALYFYQTSWRLFCNGVRNSIFQQALNEEDVNYNDALIQQLIEIYQTHQADIRLTPDAQRVLTQLNISAGHQTALITDGKGVLQWNKIRALQLKSLIETIVVTDDYGGRQYWKPNLRAFRAIQGKREPADCVYIADNPAKDFIAPRKLGWHNSVRIRRSGGLHEENPTPPDCREIISLETLVHEIGQGK